MDRRSIIFQHNPRLNGVDTTSPLSVGNGEFCFTADITGTQSFYQQYLAKGMPLCTMSQWGWHTEVNSHGKVYESSECEQTIYSCHGKCVSYPVEKKPGNEEVYEWLRENPHRRNLARIAIYIDDKPLRMSSVTAIAQELYLYEGVLFSNFCYDGIVVKVTTVCSQDIDAVAFRIESGLVEDNRLSLRVDVPYPDSGIAGGSFSKSYPEGEAIIQRAHSRRASDTIEEVVEFDGRTNGKRVHDKSFATIYASSCESWRSFWESGGMLGFSGSSRAKELERRMILSMYLLKLQSCGSLPPQETGLTCNSWYGKFHLEMHPWHQAFLPLFGRGDILKRTLMFYINDLDKARANAAKNGYRGARWQKMIGVNCEDSPSIIAPLLIWQQPHIIYMLTLLYASYPEDKGRALIEQFSEVIAQTAEFMCDFVCFNNEKGVYELLAPIIPAQERYKPEETDNPVFELQYFKEGLIMADRLLSVIEQSKPEYRCVAEKLAMPEVSDECYIACRGRYDTFSAYNTDHPSMLFAFGFLRGIGLSETIMRNTAHKVLEVWDYETLWGWDFAAMAMTFWRLGEYKKALELLLMDSPKNCYTISGNNAQLTRNDLPLYLPGNGSLLLALAFMSEKEECWPEDIAVSREGFTKYPL